MSLPSNKKFCGIFVSYRRDDSAGHTGRLFDRLVEHFGRERIFMDIDTIEPGEDFVTVIENAVGSCDVLIAVIGRNWLTAGGTSRLANPNDFVRIELATALRRNIRVIPVLVQRASMPNEQDLPEDLVKLTRRNAIELSDLRWQGDVDQLIAVMERVLAGAEHRGAEREGVVKPKPAAAEERPALEAPPRESSRAAPANRLDETAPVITKPAAPSGPKKRILMIAGAALVLLLAAVIGIWLLQPDQTSSENFNQNSVAQPSVTQEPAPATSTPTPQETTKPLDDIELVFVPPGRFMMGSEEEGEVPVHEVWFEEGFFMSKYEITQAQWQAVMGSNPSYFKNCDKCPVENVSWLEVQSFLKELNARNETYTYRLPSEAEWEYACRAGSTGNFAGPLSDLAWYKENSESRTHPVGTKAPNAFKLHDMHGNVFEWVEDVPHGSYDGAPGDGSAWVDGDGSERLVRGGSWSDPDSLLTSVYRGKNPVKKREPIVGFRVVAVQVTSQ